MTLTGSYHPGRESWVVQIGPYTLTPEQPGPPDEDWQLAGAWSLTYGPLFECRYGELGLTADPGWKPDAYNVLIWETPDTSQPPDFRGVTGIIRGNETLEGGAYTLAITGKGELDAKGRAALMVPYTAVGIAALTPEPGETTEQLHARMLEPFPDGGWGVRGDGQRVVGRALGGTPYFLPASQVENLVASGYQRQNYVTETMADPGDRWAKLYASRATDTPLTPRVFAMSSSDNLILPDVESAPPYSGTTGPQTQSKGATENNYNDSILLPPALLIETQIAAMAVRLPVSCSIPLSSLVAGSAYSASAVNATYGLKSLEFRVEVRGQSIASGSASRANYTLTREVTKSFATFTADLLVGGQPEYTAPVQLREDPDTNMAGMSETAIVPLPVPEDLVTDVYGSLGSYDVSIQGMLVVLPAYRLWTYSGPAPAAGDPVPPKYVLETYDVTGTVNLMPPKMVADKLVGAIPAGNLPPGWDSPAYSDATHQGEVPGRLKTPAYIQNVPTYGNQVVADVRHNRTPERQWSEFQTAARQTGKVTTAEGQLKRALNGGAW